MSLHHSLGTMCNRYSSTKNEAKLTLRFGSLQLSLAPRYNIAPTQRASVVRISAETLEHRELTWGWQSAHGPLTNARAETAEYKMFKDALLHRRCLVLADGFYEWKQIDRIRQPFRFITNDRSQFWFAGLWQEDQFTIMTAPARGCVATLHNRMPIILRDADLEWWLDNTHPITGSELIERCTSPDRLECYPVTTRMSNARYTAPDCIERVPIVEQQQFNLG